MATPILEDDPPLRRGDGSDAEPTASQVLRSFAGRTEKSVSLLSLVLFLPVPFVNTPPAICLALIAFGLIQRDGAIIALGIAGAAAITAALIWIAFWAGGLVTGTG